jgi:hypothetical protein
MVEMMAASMVEMMAAYLEEKWAASKVVLLEG